MSPVWLLHASCRNPPGCPGADSMRDALAPLPRRAAEALAERPAEMRRVAEAAAIGDLADRAACHARVEQVAAAGLEPALPDVLRRRHGLALEDPVDLAHRQAEAGRQ